MNINVRERNGAVVALDFSQTRHLLVAGGTAGERAAFFASVHRQVEASCPVAVVRDVSQCCDGAQYELIEVLRETQGRCVVEKDEQNQEVLNPMVVLIEDVSPLLKRDAGFFIEIICSIAQLGESVGVHLVVGASDTWRSGLPPQLLKAFPSRAVFRCENQEGYRIALGRTVKTPPGAFEFYFVCDGGRTKRYAVLMD